MAPKASCSKASTSLEDLASAPPDPAADGESEGQPQNKWKSGMFKAFACECVDDETLRQVKVCILDGRPLGGRQKQDIVWDSISFLPASHTIVVPWVKERSFPCGYAWFKTRLDAGKVFPSETRPCTHAWLA